MAHESEINELRSAIANALTRLKDLEEQTAAVESSDPGAAARESVVRALATANDGKPGYLSLPQIEQRCNMTRSAAHHHVNELEKKGKVWIRKTHDPKSGRPVHFVYHPSAVRA